MLIEMSIKGAPTMEQIEEIKKRVDSDIRLLVLKLNHLPFLVTDHSCGGHIQKNVGLYCRGTSFCLDIKNQKSNNFLSDLKDFIRKFEFVSLEEGVCFIAEGDAYELVVEDLSYYSYEVGDIRPKTREEFRACNYEKLFRVDLKGTETVEDLRARGKRKGSRNFLKDVYDQTYKVFNEELEELVDTWIEMLGIVLPKECFDLKEKGDEWGRNGHPWIPGL